MTTITIGSDEALKDWGSTCATAHAGTEVLIKQHDKPYVTLISSRKLEELQTRIAELEREKEQEAFKAATRRLGQLIIQETDATDSWVSGEALLAEMKKWHGPEFIAEAKQGLPEDVVS